MMCLVGAPRRSRLVFVFVFVFASLFVYHLYMTKCISCVRLGPLEGLATRSSTSHFFAKRG